MKKVIRDFNPRTRVGCDVIPRDELRGGLDFNPRTCVGCDLHAIAGLLRVGAFQSTHPRGVRQYNGGDLNNSKDFNPRTRVGCDLVFYQLREVGNRISIHAPAWGATRSYISGSTVIP